MRSMLLRAALGANALFSASTGLLLIGFGESAASVIGDVQPWLLRVIGGGLLAFAAFLFVNVRRPMPHPAHALIATGADLGWVAGSAVLLFLPTPILSAVGKGLIAGVAVVVLLFALLQLAGLRALARNRDGRTTARSAFDIRKRVAAPPERIWELVRDLESIGRFYPVLQSVEVTGEREGARRTCESQTGQRWSEDVIEWDEQARALTFQFDTEAPDFPFPMTEMYGGWRVEPADNQADNQAGDRADVVIWYEYTVRWGLLGEIVAPLVAQRSRGGLEAAIANMEVEARREVDVAADT